MVKQKKGVFRSVLKVGLTGGIGCGKSTAVNIFRALGAGIVDADQISKDLVKLGSPVLMEIAKIFGSEIILVDGELNRPMLKELVFTDSKALDKLEAIIHPNVRKEIDRQVSVLSSAPYVIVDIPLLVEKQYQEMFERIIVVDCLPEQQIKRVEERDSIDRATLEAIMEKQAGRDSRLKAATDILDNTCSASLLKEQVKSLHNNFINSLKNPSGKRY